MPTSLPASLLLMNLACLTSGETVPLPHTEPPPPKARMPEDEAPLIPV
jgi:hypothetical protein